MIDQDGFRANVGIIVRNADGGLLLAKRIGQDAWQFPQGGISSGESTRDAMFRELHEELGLRPEHVTVVAETRKWLRYRLPKRFLRRNRTPLCIGQKQKWFLLQLDACESNVRFDAYDVPEFEDFAWVNHDEPVKRVIFFKRDVYRKAIAELVAVP